MVGHHSAFMDFNSALAFMKSKNAKVTDLDGDNGKKEFTKVVEEEIEHMNDQAEPLVQQFAEHTRKLVEVQKKMKLAWEHSMQRPGGLGDQCTHLSMILKYLDQPKIKEMCKVAQDKFTDQYSLTPAERRNQDPIYPTLAGQPIVAKNGPESLQIRAAKYADDRLACTYLLDDVLKDSKLAKSFLPGGPCHVGDETHLNHPVVNEDFFFPDGRAQSTRLDQAIENYEENVVEDLEKKMGFSLIGLIPIIILQELKPKTVALQKSFDFL